MVTGNMANRLSNTSSITEDNDVIEHLVESCKYKEVYKYAQDELSKVLSNKTCNDLLTECTTCTAKDKHGSINCESIKRVMIILTIYQLLMNYDVLWRQISLIPILTFKNIYTLNQIYNDFIHIKDHIDRDDKFEQEFRSELKVKFKCIDLDKCHGYDRWRYRLNYSYPKWLNDDDIVFQEECDKIHSYLIHFKHDEMEEKRINHLKNGNIQKSGKGYIGEKEDEEWWDYKMEDDTKDESIYGELVENMGIFRWQSPHGFTNKQHRGLMHLKPKYKNIKEEVLNNSYYHLSTDGWNQTLRKTTVFFKSFARQRIKTWYDGKYDDQITQQLTKWKKGEVIEMQEIVILKLYTDFDKLQYELKKCFRFETIDDIFTLKNFNQNNKSIKYDCYPNEKKLRLKLEERLQTFYWWRVGLLTVLNKYGEALNNKIALYHGVNGKMIINNGKRETLSFYGPLSTSSSYHVARTFATAKGMVLQISSQYPRLGACRGFNASLISDYPEEKEWLIGFMYIRINTVLTRPLNKNWKTFDDIDKKENYYQIPLSSQTRSIFFAIHLFRQQIFSMSVHLEYWLSAFLYLSCKYNEENDNMDNGHIKKINFAKELEQAIINNKSKEFKGKIESDRHHKILNILYKQFDNFRKYPNKNQVIKIDEISDNLKPYFLDYDGKDIKKNEKYIISFTKIIKIFQNVQEIHFTNNYLFDNIALNKLIECIDKNPNHKLKKLKFLYYDYEPIHEDNNNDKIQLYPMNSQIFFDPEQLDQTLLTRLKAKNWGIKHKNIGETGYRIQLFSKSKALTSTLLSPAKSYSASYTVEANPNPNVIPSELDIDSMKSKAFQKNNKTRYRFNGG